MLYNKVAYGGPPSKKHKTFKNGAVRKPKR